MPEIWCDTRSAMLRADAVKLSDEVIRGVGQNVDLGCEEGGVSPWRPPRPRRARHAGAKRRRPLRAVRLHSRRGAPRAPVPAPDRCGRRPSVNNPAAAGGSVASRPAVSKRSTRSLATPSRRACAAGAQSSRWAKWAASPPPPSGPADVSNAMSRPSMRIPERMEAPKSIVASMAGVVLNSRTAASRSTRISPPLLKTWSVPAAFASCFRPGSAWRAGPRGGSVHQGARTGPLNGPGSRGSWR